ncbi:MAG: hypothetical protein ACD_62C00395G0019 [uncultured bacterium]|nr:MAG: hypothetical protein ACD_62C00395G0019 [uncultured bacterium]
MLKENVLFEIIDSYYGESHKTLEDIARENNLTLKDCEAQWRQIQQISQKFSQIEELQASQISINKILVVAKEHAQSSLNRVPFWASLLRPAAGFAIVLLTVMSFMVWQHHSTRQGMGNLAQNQGNENHVRTPLQQRLYSTPMDFHTYATPYFSQSGFAQKTPYLNSYVTPVSVSDPNQNTFAIDEELERKMLSKDLNDHEIDTLYFRARRFEKMGYYEDALHDYLFIVQSFPQYNQDDSLTLAIARCHEMMGDKGQAVRVLEGYQKAHPENENTRLWIDLLKSETF